MNADERKPRIPNAAKILHAYMQCCGVTDSHELAEQLGIPLRTIQHLKREAAQLCDANSAKGCAQTAQDVAQTQMVAPQKTQRVAPSDARGCAETQGFASLARADGKITNNNITTNNNIISFKQPERVWWNDDGSIGFDDSFADYWLASDLFAGDRLDLDLAVVKATGYIQPRSSKPLEAQLSSQLAETCRMKRERDKRYAAAKQASQQPKIVLDAERWAAIERRAAEIGG